MREDLLHFVWKHHKLQPFHLRTTRLQPLRIVEAGIHNQLSGPDFFNAKIEIGEQLWAGNVEMHVKASDWYVHGHEEDPKYQNVILHVVWEYDGNISRKNGSEIATLELKNVVPPRLLQSYKHLFDNWKRAFINCESEISEVDSFVKETWLTRLYVERLQCKSNHIQSLLTRSNNDWEEVCFTLLLKNFGSKINGDAFLSLAKHLKFSVVRKLMANRIQLESALYGMLHLLDDPTIVDSYYLTLRREYAYIRRKYRLDNIGVLQPEFFKLRPFNFPTVRLSQIAHLYVHNKGLFEQVVRAPNVSSLYSIFECTANAYWDDHYTFGKPSKGKPKRVTKTFIDLLIINTVIPLKFCYFQSLGKDVSESVLHIIGQIKAERNSVIGKYAALGIPSKTALESQALLQMYTEYCTVNRCLDCAIGSRLLDRNV